MKGIVFNKFLEIVEEQFDYKMVDIIIVSSNLPHHGGYTTVGPYPHSEMVALVQHLSTKTGISVPVLLKNYGVYAFGVFAKAYSDWITAYTAPLDFLNHIEDANHTEVLKLYPEAQLLSLTTVEKKATEMTMIYKSSKAMFDFAKGLVKGCMLYYNTKAEIEETALKSDNTEIQFKVKLRT